MDVANLPISKLFNYGDRPMPPVLTGFASSMEASIPLPNHRIGIEFELENWCTEAQDHLYNAIPSALYDITDDGSLRNNGVEIVTKPITAVQGLYFARVISELPVTYGPRTSTHVHVNVRDLTSGQLLTLVNTYAVVEKLIYDFVGPSRRRGVFCVPLQESSLPRTFSMYKETKLLNITTGWLKYSGLNLKPINSYGTVEFRHFTGCSDYPKFEKWIHILMSLVKFAQETSPDEALERLYGLNTNSAYSAFLNDVFGTVAKEFIGNPKYKKYLEEGVSFIKSELVQLDPFTRAVREWDQDAPLSLKLFPKPKKTPIKKKVEVNDPLANVFNDDNSALGSAPTNPIVFANNLPSEINGEPNPLKDYFYDVAISTGNTNHPLALSQIIINLSEMTYKILGPHGAASPGAKEIPMNVIEAYNLLTNPF